MTAASTLFSTRVRMEKAAVEWCRDLGVSPTPFNIVTALSSLGLLAEQERIQEWLHTQDQRQR